MDIRKARQPLGAMPPKTVANEAQPAKSADINDKGETVLEELNEFGGDFVIKGYMDFLTKNGVSQTDVEEAMEVLLTTGSISWSFDLFGRIPVEFIARPAWIDSYISEILDNVSSESKIVSNIRYNNIVAECNLAASLAQYGDKKFSVFTKEDMEKSRDFTRGLPYVTHNALVKKLAVFDRLLAVATSDWAVKNFTKPQPEKSERD